MRKIALAILVMALGTWGCGGEETPNADDKDAISNAALTISSNCLGGDANVAEVEDGVTALIEEADEAGDARFTLSEAFTDVTVDDILRDRVTFMRENDCVPEQADRLEEAAG
jgi:hypothetical protein